MVNWFLTEVPRQSWGKYSVFHMVLRPMDIHMILDPYLTPYMKINSKWLIDPNVKTIKLLE